MITRGWVCVETTGCNKRQCLFHSVVGVTEKMAWSIFLDTFTFKAVEYTVPPRVGTETAGMPGFDLDLLMSKI